MVYEIAHFGYNSATVCILTHRQLSAPIWKLSSNSSYTSDQNHCSLSILDVLRTSQGWIWSQIALLGNRASATHLPSSKFVCKNLHVKSRKRLKQDHRTCADYNNRSINLPPKPDIIVAFLSRRRRTVCKRRACLVLTAHYTVQWVHTIPVIRQKLYFETGTPQILLISERGRRSNIEFITKILQMCCRKNGIVLLSFTEPVSA